ncbi:hypothetical protein IFY47_003382 [Salmonella enterica]|nr:hypothetical protein [Salmonella enterica]
MPNQMPLDPHLTDLSSNATPKPSSRLRESMRQTNDLIDSKLTSKTSAEEKIADTYNKEK